MRTFLLLMTIAFTACESRHESQEQVSTDSATQVQSAEPMEPVQAPTNNTADTVVKPAADTGRTYANARFREVRVKKTGEDEYLVSGKGQIFEASFSWVVEDGHHELKQGHEMTDAGAPEWGNFSFKVQVKPKQANTKLHLILYEASAKDGSRQYELPIPLN
jgi:hypothetical protein